MGLVKRVVMRRHPAVFALAALVVASVALTTRLNAADVAPWTKDIAYGPDPSQALDIYRPDTGGPVPVVLYIHGGGWWGGDKQYANTEIVRYLLEHGIGFVTINYRTLPDAKREGIFPPLLAPLQDARRALEYIRRNQDELKLDSTRVALFGASAGGFNALWLGLSQSLPGTDVATEGVRAIAGIDAQTSIDPEQMRHWVGPGLAYGGHAFGLNEQSFEEFLSKRAEFEPYFAQLSPAALVGSDAPPIFLLYMNKTLETRPDDMYYVHSPNFGTGFAALAKEKGAAVTVVEDGKSDPSKKLQLLDFLVQSLKD